jgi:hypothetical protein
VLRHDARSKAERDWSFKEKPVPQIQLSDLRAIKLRGSRSGMGQADPTAAPPATDPGFVSTFLASATPCIPYLAIGFLVGGVVAWEAGKAVHFVEDEAGAAKRYVSGAASKVKGAVSGAASRASGAVSSAAAKVRALRK